MYAAYSACCCAIFRFNLALLGLSLATSCFSESTATSGGSGERIGFTAHDEGVRQRVYTEFKAEEGDFIRMGNPRPGEWLHSFREVPQTLENYRLSVRTRPTRERGTIVIQPLGAVPDKHRSLLDNLLRYTAIYFQLPVRMDAPMAIDEHIPEIKRQVTAGSRRAGYTHQFNAEQLLKEQMLKKLPADAVVYFGITFEDLYVDKLNYVFGLGSYTQRVGIFSLARFFPEFWGEDPKDGDPELVLQRGCKLVNHEIGHCFGLSHCVFYKCTLNGSNSLAETDAAPIHECPVCHAKLAWNIGFDPLVRFDALERFYRERGLITDADWIKPRRQRYAEQIKRKLEESIGDE